MAVNKCKEKAFLLNWMTKSMEVKYFQKQNCKESSREAWNKNSFSQKLISKPDSKIEMPVGKHTFQTTLKEVVCCVVWQNKASAYKRESGFLMKLKHFRRINFSPDIFRILKSPIVNISSHKNPGSITKVHEAWCANHNSAQNQEIRPMQGPSIIPPKNRQPRMVHCQPNLIRFNS